MLSKEYGRFLKEIKSRIFLSRIKAVRKDNMTESLVSKVWSFCNVLKDDGVGIHGKNFIRKTYEQ